MSIFDEIRAKTRLVVETAKYVTIHFDKMETYARNLPIEKIQNPPLDADIHYLGQGYDTLLYFLSLEAINFGSGYFPYLKKGVNGSGYYTIAKAWRAYFIEKKTVTAKDFVVLTTQDCTRIFNQETDNEPIQQLMAHFSEALQQLGFFLLERFDGQVSSFFSAVNHSVEKLVSLLLEMPYFQDISGYNGVSVPILKRAQITAADIALAFSNKGLGYFRNLDQLTIFADNMVPHVLRCDGILEYHPDLAKKIDTHQLLVAGSIEEIEIRAAAIHAVEVLRATFNEMGYSFTAIDLDYLLWNRGQDAFYRKNHSVHLCRTIFY